MGQQGAGLGASKGADAPWPKGSFPETSDLWQREWFYITAPRSTKWVAAPAFRSGPPPQLASWVNKGLDWGPVNDVPTLQSRIRDLLKRDVSLVKVMQVMLVRRVLLCQRRSLCMWEFNPEGPQTIQQFFGVTLEEIYGLFFEARIRPEAKGLRRGSIVALGLIKRRVNRCGLGRVPKKQWFIKVMQVMLVRRVLPCQRRPLRMWEFNPEGPRTIQQFFGVTLEEMYGLFFGSRIKCLDTTEDAGLNCNRPDTHVSNSAAEHAVF